MSESSKEFLAKIRLVLEGKEDAVAGLQNIQKTTGQMAGKQVEFPWLKNIPAQTATASASLQNFTTDLKGFANIGQKVNTVWQEGEPVGAKIVQTYKNQSGVVKQLTQDVDKNGKITGQSLTEITKSASDAHGIMGQLGMAMKRALVVAPVWMIMRAAIQAVTNTIRDQVKFLIDLETAMTRIKIVGKGTADEFTHLQNTLIALSVAYGTSATDAVQAAMIFAQQGKTVAETLELTQKAMLSAQVLGTDVKTTVDSLTAAMNGFNISAKNSSSIIDKWVNVEKNFAVTSKDLADATKAAGATANQMGVSISEFLGDVTSIIEVTRKSGSEAARALSFVYARLFTTAQNTIQKIAQVKFYLDEQGQATNALTGQLRPVADVLSDLASKWSDLTREEKLQVAESLGSKRQMVGVNALMQNYTRSVDARIAALASAGAAEKAFNLVQETTAFKLKQITSNWNSVSNALTDTAGFRIALDAMNGLLIGITSFIDAEKGYRASIASTISQEKIAAESRFSMAGNLKELIELRNKLLNAPTSDKTTERINIINNAIDTFVSKEPELKIAIEVGDTQSINTAIEEVQRQATKSKIVLDASLKFDPMIKEVENLSKSLSAKMDKSLEKVLTERVIALEKQKTKEIEEQYQIILAEQELKRGIADITEEEVDNLDLLTEKDREILDINKQLAVFNSQYSKDKSAQIEYEIKLVEASKAVYTQREKIQKIQELETSLLQERLQLQEKEKQFTIDLITQTAKLKGMSDSRVTALTAALTKTMMGESALRDNTSLRLKLEENITREKLNQVNIGNESLKLYEIAKKQGTGVASEIGKFVTGQIDFQQLQAMPRVLETFKTEFADWFKQIQAAQFLGIPFRGFGNLGGQRQSAPGSSIPIPEFESMKQLQVPTPAQGPAKIQGLNVTVNTNLSKEDSTEQKTEKIVIDIAEAIRSDMDVKKAIAEQIEEF